MPDSGIVEIRISGSVDVSLGAAAEQAIAQIANIGAQAQASTKLISEAMSRANAGLDSAQRSSRATAESFHLLGDVSAGARGHILDLALELVQGNFARAPRAILSIATEMAGASLASFGLVGAALAVAGAVGYAVTKQIEAVQANNALAASYALTGHSAAFTQAAIGVEVDRLSALPGVTDEAARALLGFDAAHANLNTGLAMAANQLIPQYVAAMGDQAPAGLNEFKQSLITISTGSIPQAKQAFEELNRTKLNLPEASVKPIMDMIEANNGLGAAMQVVVDQAANAHVPIQSLGDRIKSTSTSLSEARHEVDLYSDALKVPSSNQDVLNASLLRAQLKVEALTASMKLLNGVQAALMSASGEVKLPSYDALNREMKTEAYLSSLPPRERAGASKLIAQANNVNRDKGGEPNVTDLGGVLHVLNPAQINQTSNLAFEAYDNSHKGGGGGDAAAAAARRTADEIAQIQQQAAERHVAFEERTNDLLLSMGQRTNEEWKSQAEKLENDRFNIQMKALQRSEANDRGNAGALAKDKAQEESLQQAHDERLIEIDQRFQQRKRQNSEEGLRQFIADQNERLSSGNEEYEAEYQRGEINEQQRRDLEVSLTEAVQREVLARFDAEHTGLVDGTDDYKKAMKEREDIVAGFGRTVKRTNDTLANEEAQKWKTLSGSIRSSFNSALNGLIFEGNSLRQFMANTAKGIAQAFLAMGEKIAEDWIEQQIRMLFASQASEAAQTAVKGAGETGRTAATVAGVTARTTAEATGRAAGSAAEAASGSAQIMNDAYKAAAGAYQAVVGIPIIGPFLAPVAAGIAFAAVTAFDMITSAEGGQERVLAAEQLTMLHRDEMVLPASIATPLRGMLSDVPLGLGSGMSPAMSFPRAASSDTAADYVMRALGGSAPRTGHHARGGGDNYHFHALDARSFKTFLQNVNNRRVMTRFSRDGARNGLKVA